MPNRPIPSPSRARGEGASTFDRLTLNAFMLAVTVAAAAVLSYGPAAAFDRLGAALSADVQAMPVPDDAAWQGLAVF